MQSSKIPHAHTLTLARFACEYIEGTRASAQDLALCHQLSGHDFITHVWRPALNIISPPAVDNSISGKIERFNKLLTVAQNHHAFRAPDIEAVRELFQSVLDAPNMPTQAISNASPLILSVAKHIASVRPHLDWSEVCSPPALKDLMRLVYRKQHETPKEIEASVRLLSHIARSKGLSDPTKALAGLMCQYFAATRGVDFVSPLVLSKDKQAVSFHLLAQPHHPIVFHQASLYGVFPFLYNYDLVGFSEDKSSLIGLARKVLTRSPDLADIMFDQTQHDRTKGDPALHDVVGKFSGLGMLFVARMNKICLEVCFEFASPQACVELYNFYKDHLLDVPDVIASRAQQVLLNQALQRDGAVSDKINDTHLGRTRPLKM